MTLQKAAEIIKLELAQEAPYHPSDFYTAVGLFMPIIKAAAYLEFLHLQPVIQSKEEGEQP